MENKKWFMSKKFWTPIVAALVVALNGALGWQIPAEQVGAVLVPFVIFLIGEFLLDAKRENGSNNPLHDPAVRDAIEDLISEFYDYAAAKNEGIQPHAEAVKDRVMEAISLLINPKYLKHTDLLAEEIIRRVLKIYKEDRKMQEGADLVKASIPSGGKAQE